MAPKIPVIQLVIAEMIERRKPATPLIRPDINEAIELTIPLKQEKIDPILFYI
jgi:hypothetical protein